MSRIIAIIGKAGTGKDTFAQMLVSEATASDRIATTVAFATPLKSFAQYLFELTDEQVFGASASRDMVIRDSGEEWWWTNAEYRFFDRMGSWLLSVLPTSVSFKIARAKLLVWFYSMYGQQVSPRYILQTLGTEFGRTVHPDIWAEAGLRKAAGLLHSDADLVVITDCRFVNEAAGIRRLGGEVVKLVRPARVDTTTTGVYGHASETEQESPEMEQHVTRIVQNIGNLDDLRAMAKMIIAELLKEGEIVDP